MGKKCIPGIICIENMTLFILCILIGLVIYFIYSQSREKQTPPPSPQKIVIVSPPPQPSLNGIATRMNDSFNDPYAPPLKNDGYIYPINSSDVRGIPVNIETRGTGMSYQQVGILTPVGGNSTNDLILPLMGRKLMNGRDKWQYYTMANGSSTIHTKLPVSVNGKSCTGEYGCNDIQNGDTVYVEGYNTVFNATVYENGTFSYIPYI
jgi:hypothetical protein